MKTEKMGSSDILKLIYLEDGEEEFLKLAERILRVNIVINDETKAYEMTREGDESKCPSCKADLTKDGAITVAEFLIYGAEFDVDGPGIRQDTGAKSSEVNIFCTNCRSSLGDLNLLN